MASKCLSLTIESKIDYVKKYVSYYKFLIVEEDAQQPRGRAPVRWSDGIVNVAGQQWMRMGKNKMDWRIREEAREN